MKYWYVLFNPEEQIMSCYSADNPEKYIEQIRTECYPGSKSERMGTVQFQTILEHGGVDNFYAVILNEKPSECKWVCRWFWYGDMPRTIKWTYNHLDWKLYSSPKEVTNTHTTRGEIYRLPSKQQNSQVFAANKEASCASINR